MVKFNASVLNRLKFTGLTKIVIILTKCFFSVSEPYNPFVPNAPFFNPLKTENFCIGNKSFNEKRVTIQFNEFYY